MIGLYRLCMKWCGPSNATRSFLRKLTYVLIVGMIAMGSFTIMGFYNAGEEAAKLDPEAHSVPGWLRLLLTRAGGLTTSRRTNQILLST